MLRGSNIGRGTLVAILTGLLVLWIGGDAEAATVTVGSALSGLSSPGVFTNAATLAPSSLPAPAIATSPTDGTVISWRYIGTGTFTPRVVRPSGSNYVGAGTGTPQPSTASPPAISGPFTIDLPIKKGDLFGVDANVGATLRVALGPSVQYVYFEPPLADGGTGTPPTTVGAAEFALSAVVRYCQVPKLKGKSPKAAKKALRSADCTLGKIKKSKKDTNKKKVLSQTVAPGTSVSDSKPIGFKVSR